MSVVDYFGKWTNTRLQPTVGSAILRQVALGRMRELAKHEPGASQQTAFVPRFLFQVLLWLPFMTDCNLETRWTKLFPPLSCFLSEYFITATEWNWNTSTREAEIGGPLGLIGQPAHQASSGPMRDPVSKTSSWGIAPKVDFRPPYSCAFFEDPHTYMNI